MGLIFLPKPRLRLKHTSPADTLVTVDERSFQILKEIEEEAGRLPDKESRELWLDAVRTFMQTGDIDALVEITKWRRRVVPIDEFMFGKAYLGMDEDQTYPAVFEACIELDTDKYVEAVLTGAVGTGKSTIGNVMLGRNIYKLSCMRHPQTTFGIQSKSSIVFTIQSVRLGTAKKAVFQEFGQYIKHSPYFKNIYPYDHHIQSEMIFREQNVSILPVASSNTGAISMNVIGGALDEVNYMQKIDKSKSSYAEMDGSYDQAKQLYDTLSRRRRSRFVQQGKLPGILFLISSSRFPDDFTEKKSAEAAVSGGTDNQIFVYRHSQWSAKARDTFLPGEFKVAVGTEKNRSRMIDHSEPTIKMDDGTERLASQPDTMVIAVPMDFHKQFRDDTDGSLRDYAGVTTMATKPFMPRRDAIYECMQDGTNRGYKHPFNVEEADLSLGIPKIIFEALRTDIRMFRHVHVDLGQVKDACGISCGYIDGTKVVSRLDAETGRNEIIVLPKVAIDFCLRVVPPPGGEIEFSQVRALLYKLRGMGLPIKYVTYDGFQSVDSRQILKKKGFLADLLSVEKDMAPYRTLRDAIYEGRVAMPLYQIVTKELSELEITTVHGKEKVDHRPQGHKDVADSLCGVVAFLMKRRAAWAGIHVPVGESYHEQFGEQTEDESEDKPEDTTPNPMRSKVRRSTVRKTTQRKQVVVRK